MFQSFRGPGRYLSKSLVQSGTCTWLLATNQKREREMPPNKRSALSLRCDDDGGLDVASRPKKGEKSMVFMKRLTLSTYCICNATVSD